MSTSPLKAFLLFFFFLTHSIASPHGFSHPFDPLTSLEITQVQTIVTTYFISSLPYSMNNKKVHFHYVGLDEPDKPTIDTWLSSPSSSPPPRQAFVIVRVGQETHELNVDLSNNSVISNKLYNGVGFPTITSEEIELANGLPLTYPPFIASMEKRGLKLEEIVCESNTIGWYGEKENSERYVKVVCYYLNGTVNLYMRPIEGVMTTVDLDQMRVTWYRDRAIIPIPKSEGTDYRQVKEAKGEEEKVFMQHDQPNLSIDGHIVR